MLQVVSQTNRQYPKDFHTADRLFHEDTNPSDPAILSLLLTR
jgi:hypothetical protein